MTREGKEARAKRAMDWAEKRYNRTPSVENLLRFTDAIEEYNHIRQNKYENPVDSGYRGKNK